MALSFAVKLRCACNNDSANKILMHYKAIT